MKYSVFCLVFVLFFSCGMANGHASPVAFGSLSAQNQTDLRVLSGAWQQAQRQAGTRRVIDDLRLPPKKALSLSDHAFDPLGVLKQAQSTGLAFPTVGSPAFMLFMVEVGLMVGSIVVSIGSSIVQQNDGDLTGWKVAGLIIDGISLVTAIGMIAGLHLSSFPAFFSIIIYV